ncbi:MAG: glycosyltransferase family 39 protein [Candidatus Zixiibacteriota bacterium]|nr:MAG: glycosyltransferase family 39 protein [candidate division Zixibacteria bacterium]
MAVRVKDNRIWNRPAFALVVLPALAFLLNVAYLRGGFFLDDFYFLNILADHPRDFDWWRGLWSVKSFTGFEYLWWKDPNWSGYFWRPIPSMVIVASLRLFGHNPFPLHLVSLLLHAGVTASLYLLVQKLSGRHWLAFLTGLFFATCEDHAMWLGWISTLTEPMCVQFILLALLSHTYWLKRRKPAALAGSLAAMILALGCKETAVVAPVAVILLSLLMPTGTDDEGLSLTEGRKRITRLVKDPLCWVPAALLLAGYITFYKLTATGNMNTFLYIDPLTQPGAYLTHLVAYSPIMWLGTFSPAPPVMPIFFPQLVTPYIVAGVAVFLLWLLALWAYRRRSLAWWAFIIYFVALMPQLCTDASERNMYFPLVVACMLIAMVAGSIGPIARRLKPESPLRPRWTRFIGWIAVIIVLIPGTLLSTVRPWLMVPSFGRNEAELLTALPHIERERPEHTLILNTSSSMLCLYTWDILNYHLDSPEHIWLLSAASGVFSLERTGDSSFVIRTDRHGWLDSWFARVMRTEKNLHAGQQYHTAAFTATLLEMTGDGSDVLTARFDLVSALNDERWLFLYWNGQAFEPLDIAQFKVGQAMELADTSDLFKTMMQATQSSR